MVVEHGSVACRANLLARFDSRCRMTSRAIGLGRYGGGSGVFGIGPDLTVGLARHEAVVFNGVVQAINVLGVTVAMRQHRPRPVPASMEARTGSRR